MTFMRAFFFGGLVFLAGAAFLPVSTQQEPAQTDLTSAVLQLFEGRCAQCHGPDSFAAGGMNFILSPAQLAAEGIIEPGNHAASKLYEEVSTGEMPADGTAPLPDEDIQMIANWIDELDPDQPLPAGSAAAESTEGDAEAAEGDAASQPSDGAGDQDEDGFMAQFGKWLGKFHPLVVHFPIALIICAGLFELLALIGLRLPLLSVNAAGWRSAARIAVWFGAVTALVAGPLGWLNAWDHFFSTSLQDDLFWHRWLGSGVSVLAVLTAWFSEKSHRAIDRGEDPGSASLLYRLLLFITFILIGLVGHLGGTLVFGEAYYAF